MFPLSSSTSSYSSISRNKYDVFLSFRGDDTRKNFTDHLYAALKRGGIVTFRDDPRLEAGEEIAPELSKAIQESWCSVIVFSKTYSFSGWCLDELAQIVEQRNKRGHKIFPIFYDVDPSDLRKQTGSVKEAFAKHEDRYKENKDKTKRWRTAFTEVANIEGWHLNNRHESKFIGDIVKKILANLCQTYTTVPDELIGINSRLEELYLKVGFEEDRVRIIGICGMGGIGKTTLARVFYTQMLPHFEAKSFLVDVREFSEKNGLVSLQKQLLSQILMEEDIGLFNVHEGNIMISQRLCHKKVLLVIDDADNIQHLKCLVGRREWFGLGSRIIVTTRDEHLLRSYGVDDVYKPTTLNAKESLRLFSLKAFNSDKAPGNDLVELSKCVVNYTGGLPLALEVLGSFLCGRDATQWRNAIERLKRDSNKEILDRLQISFDGLEETEKNIFLDIACFFNGEYKDFVMKVLDGCEFFPHIGIDVLIKKSLIKVDKDNKMRMHVLLQEMGRKIVRQKSVDDPGKRCRLWDEKDVYHVLTNNTATEVIEGMVIENKGEQNKMFTLNCDAFLKMKKLRLLKIFYLINCDDLKYLFNELRLLEWHGYPFKSLPSGFQLDNLVALLLPYSSIQQLWKRNMPLYKLKCVNLKGSINLIKTPDFTLAPNLESLILEGCTRIVDVHPSIGALSKLKVLNLRDCKSLRSLPQKIGMEILEALILSGCSNLQSFPEIDREMGNLLEIHLDGTSVKELPSSIRHLNGLKLLKLGECKSLRRLPTQIVGMKSLEILNLSGCSSLESFPEIDDEMECLLELYLDGTGIKELPSSIRHLSNLVLLNLKDCTNLVSLPSSIDGCKSLKTLDLSGCSKVETLPENLQHVKFLEELDLSETAIREPPFFIFQFKNLKVLSFNGCKEPPLKLRSYLPFFKGLHGGSTVSMAVTLPPLSGLTSLRMLNLNDCKLCEGAIPDDICCLSSLRNLDLSGNNFNNLPATLGRLPKLRFLMLSDCRRLKSLPDVSTGLRKMTLDGCSSLGFVANPTKVSNSIDLGTFRAINCHKFAEKNNALMLLKRHLKLYTNARRLLDILIPGSEIPKWFHHTKECDGYSFKIPWFHREREWDTHSINIPLPLNIRKDSQWMGVALCCVFVSNFTDDDVCEKAALSCNAVIHRRISRYVYGDCFLFGREHRRPRVKKEHIWLRYWSRDMLYPFSSKDKCGDTEKLSRRNLEDRECDEIFEANIFCGIGLKIKRYGIRIMYEKDLEEIDQVNE